MISFAICVCDEARELNELLQMLTDTIRKIDEIQVLVDTSKVTTDVRLVLEKFPRAQVHEREFKDDFAAHKNYLNSKCRGDYIFNLDADEVPSETLVRMAFDVKDLDLVYVPRVNIVPGITESELKQHKFHLNEVGFINWPDFQGRIYRNHPSIRWVSEVHEKIQGAAKIGQIPVQPIHAIWHVKSRAKQMKQNQKYLEIEKARKS
jgi:hypothetical protein